MNTEESMLDSEELEVAVGSADAPPLSRDREVRVIQELRDLAIARAETEVGIRADLAAGLAEADTQFEARRQEVEDRVVRERRTAEDEYEAQRKAVQYRYETDNNAMQSEYDEALDKLLAEFEQNRLAGEKTKDDACWEAKTVFDATKDAPGKQFQEFQDQIDATLNELVEKQEAVRKVLRKWRQHAAAEYTAQQDTPGYEQYDPRATLKQCGEQAEATRLELLGLKSPALFQGLGVLWMYVLLGMVFCAVSLLLQKGPVGLAIAASAAFVLGTLIAWVMYSSAKSQVNELFPSYCQSVRDAAGAHGRCVTWAEMLAEKQRKELVDALHARMTKAETALREWMDEINRRRDAQQEKIDSIYPPRLARILETRDRDLQSLDTARRRRAEDIENRYQRDIQENVQRQRRQRADLQQTHDDQWQALADAWMSGLAKIQADVRDTQQRSAKLFPDWKVLAGKPWTPASESPPAVRLGQFELSLAQIPSAIPDDSSLKIVTPASYVFPAVVPFPAGCSLVYKARSTTGRAAAVQSMQAVMLRLLTAIPPSKCRFTIVDPLGLGENFSAFMHLADHDEALVTNRIWTDPRHIEQRLADISEHMENVIQKYLRNEFATIEEYNAHAGEIAEPFRFLVIADFPHNFSDAAAKRLTSIAASGARCGVFTIVSVDTTENLPEGFNLRDLERQGTTLFWKKDRFYLKDRALLEFPLAIDVPPAADDFTAIVHAAGRNAKIASRVEVPFEFIAPPADEVWTSDSRKIVDVPLGRAGATRLQHMQLGLGTSQHALVAGKTGSGKSTLLHALITNSALRYSPDELELYLIDFKKGVEFKTYATHELPHARVVAVESDREFGLSVLERLDLELKRRADAYRAVGAQDVSSYRALTGQSLPRILLIIDEFQEFFMEDDRVAQDTSLLLDRLVRQGRAFGVHVMLGSQTLGGAYSLARSTLGQMAVRIALQCSEADAHLILSEDNTAARLLSRPGEAIYNDSNGMVEGNHPFQVVWLPDEVREGYLISVRDRARREKQDYRPRIVFEGNVPAEIDKNSLLDRLLRQKIRPGTAEEQYFWLGESVAIKDPTAAVFRPQSGSNLLIVGQNEEATLGMFTAGMLALGGQALPGPDLQTSFPGGGKFYIFDGAPAGSPQSAALAALPELLPCGARHVPVRELPAAVAEVAAEVARRQQSGEKAGAPIYLFVYGLQRFRDLRKDEDDFGSFSRMGEEKPPSPGKQFGVLLREGPPVGVHVIVWVDSLNNLQRAWDRQTLREFEMRILFQMSANDSSTLIDGPAATRLGMHRALFHSEEQARLEKFRPYGSPAGAWLEWAKGELRAGR